MKFIFLITLSLIALLNQSCGTRKSNNQGELQRSKSAECMTYPAIVDSLNFQKLYDSARLAIFTWHCDKPYRPKNDSLKRGSFGELSLRFDHLVMKSDTVEFVFNFFDSDKIVIATALKDLTDLHTGVGYNVRTNRKLYMSSPSGFIVSERGQDSRYENPLQPEVLNYINNNWDRLNPCFRKLAGVRR